MLGNLGFWRTGLKCLVLKRQVPLWSPKINIFTVMIGHRKRISSNISQIKYFLLNFENLSTIFCPRLMVFHEEETKGQKVALKRLFLALNLTLIKKELAPLKERNFFNYCSLACFRASPTLIPPFCASLILDLYST